MSLLPQQKGFGLLQKFWAYVECDGDGDEDIMPLQPNPRILAMFRTEELAISFTEVAAAHAKSTGHLVFLTHFTCSGDRPI